MRHLSLKSEQVFLVQLNQRLYPKIQLFIDITSYFKKPATIFETIHGRLKKYIGKHILFTYKLRNETGDSSF